MKTFALLSLAVCAAAAPNGWTKTQEFGAATKKAKSSAEQTSGCSAEQMIPFAPRPANAASKFYVANASNLVCLPDDRDPECWGSLVEVNAQTGEMSVVAQDVLESRYSYVSASVVCDNTWYAVWTQFPIDKGLVSVDLSTGKTTYMGTAGLLGHALACSDEEGMLLMAAGETGGTDGVAQFLTTFNTTSQSVSIVGEFPPHTWGGYDAVFTFNEDKTELWYTAPIYELLDFKSTSELFRMSVATGEILENKRFVPTTGLSNFAGAQAYHVVPSQGDSFTAVFWKFFSNGLVKHCQVDKSGEEIELSDCVDAAEFRGRVPHSCADGFRYVLSDTGRTRNVQPVHALDTNVTLGTPDKILELATPGCSHTLDCIACGL